MNNFFNEIQYLRFLSVCFVFLFHLDKTRFSGGFIGVDIFFVISGYLITASLEKNSSLTNYFLKRIKRIVPSLFLIQFIALVFVLIFFLKEHQVHFLKSYVFSSFFINNFFFWITLDDYFSISKIYVPLLHTWSVSLEFQFYLVLPFIYLYILKKKKFLYLILLFFGSLLASYLFIGREQSFYLLPFRLHEFLIGVSIFYLPRIKINEFINDFIFIILNILLICFLFYFNEINFPGLKAAFVCIIAFLIIYFNNYRYSKIIINNEIVIYIGKISYTFFLIHWPVIVFFKYFLVRDLNLFENLLIIVISLLSSSLIFHYFENIFLKMKNFLFIKYILFFYLFLFLFLFIFISFSKTSYYLDLKKKYYSNFHLVNELKSQSPNFSGFDFSKNTYVKNKSNDSTIFFGDSHAFDLFFSFENYSTNHNFFYIKNDLDCFKILKEKKKELFWFDKLTNLIFSKKPVGQILSDNCKKSFNELSNILKSYNVRNIFISMKWNNDEINNLDFLIDQLNERSIISKVYIVSKRVQIADPIRSLLRISNNNDDINLYFNKNKTLFNELNKRLFKFANKNKLLFFDINKYILMKDKFLFINTNNQLTYIDYSHFSISKGKEVSKKIFREIIKPLN